MLITNYTLATRSGTEVYVRDLALELLRQGDQPVVYSPDLGAPAQELRDAGVEVTDAIGLVARRGAVDLIHGHHAHTTLIALGRLPTVPALFLCHDAAAWHDDPPLHPRILRYAAVDERCQQRVAGALGLPLERVRLLHNFVDLQRFRRGEPRPARPRRALIFSNAAEPGSWSDMVAEACRRRGLAVDVAGLGAGRVLARPEDVLPSYDVVFAKAKAAMEAMVSGAAVVLCDKPGLGPLVTAAAFDALRLHNFGRAVLSDPHTVEGVLARLAAYDAAEAERVCTLARSRLGLPEAVREIRALHREVLDERAAAAPPDPTAELLSERAGLLRFLESLGARNPLVVAAQREGEAACLRTEVARLTHEVNVLKDRYVRGRLSVRLRRALRRLRGKGP